MSRIFLIISAALSFTLLSACSSQPSYFEAVQPSTPERAVVYIFRPVADNPGLQPLRLSYPVVTIDGQSVGVLKFNTYFHVDLAAGSHKFRITGLIPPAKWAPEDIEQTVSLSPGEVTYLKLDVQYNKSMALGQQEAPEHQIFLTPMRSQDAIYEIRETNRRSP